MVTGLKNTYWIRAVICGMMRVPQSRCCEADMSNHTLTKRSVRGPQGKLGFHLFNRTFDNVTQNFDAHSQSLSPPLRFPYPSSLPDSHLCLALHRLSPPAISYLQRSFISARKSSGNLVLSAAEQIKVRTKTPRTSQAVEMVD